MLEETKITEEFAQEMNTHRQPPLDKGLIEACSESIIIFAEKMLGFSLYSWQVDFLIRIQKALEGNYYTREFVALTSRQIGKSTAVAIFALWCCIFNKVPGTVFYNTSALIFSASDTQAKKLLKEVKKFIRLGDSHVERTYLDGDEPMFGKKFFTDLLDEGESNNTTTITFKRYDKEVHNEFILSKSLSGSTIKSYPPTSGVLGETASIVIEDEAGKTDKITDEFHYDFASPTGDECDAIRLYTSTPWKPSGFFYRLADPEDDHESHPADRVLYTIEAIKDENPRHYGVVQKKIKILNEDGKTDEVQRAYYCRFVKGESSYFSPKKIFTMFDDTLSKVEAFTGMCDMGVDFGGQVKSRTVITITRLTPDNVIERLYHKSYEVGKDLSLLEDMADLMKRFNIQRIIPDDCPAGDFLIKTMKEKGWNVHPMSFRSDKVKKYGAFRSYLNRNPQLIASYPDDVLKTEMLALEQSETSQQSKIIAPHGYSDDLIDSFVMSAYFMLVEDSDYKSYDWEEDKPSTIMEKIRAKRQNTYEGVSNCL